MTQASFNPGTLLIVGALFGFLAFFVSEGFKRVNGVTPWNLSSWLWGAIGFLSLLVCAILMAVAVRQTKAKLRAASGGLPSPTPAAGVAPYGASASVGASGPAPTPGHSSAAAPPAWHPDPAGRHRFRYWDGSMWTEYVNDGTTNAIDPL
jgi:hypothetical protein